MRVTTLHLKNGYKRFHDLTIDLGPSPAKVVALLGPNGCGKSSVLDAMLFHSNAYGMIGNKSQRDYKYHSMNGIHDYNFENVSITFTTGRFDRVRESRLSKGTATTIFSFRSPYRYNSNLDVRESKAVSELTKNNY